MKVVEQSGDGLIEWASESGDLIVIVVVCIPTAKGEFDKAHAVLDESTRE